MGKKKLHRAKGRKFLKHYLITELQLNRIWTICVHPASSVGFPNAELRTHGSCGHLTNFLWLYQNSLHCLEIPAKQLPEQPNSWLLSSFLLPSSKGSPSSTNAGLAWIKKQQCLFCFVIIIYFTFFIVFFSWNLQDLPQQQHGADVSSAMGASADLFSAAFCTSSTENLLPSKGAL